VLHAALEALEKVGHSYAMAHFTQVYPINPQVKKIFGAAKRLIVIENNQSAQFSRLLEQELSIKADHHILKFNGLQFNVAELATAIREVL